MGSHDRIYKLLRLLKQEIDDALAEIPKIDLDDLDRLYSEAVASGEICEAEKAAFTRRFPLLTPRRGARNS